ncbi:MAG: transcriptional regulator, LuxR family [Eubacterium sp.]|jgi:LuxR family maltose regulon positive regulatory protein|nr:transcriptional regulator, LuxR family [Eubacterium sp.]
MNSKIKFISTKLKMPAPRKNFVRRVELFKKLEGISEYRVVLVKGVAGSGKTTLLTSFIKDYSHMPFKWLTLEGDNNNIFSFWYYFVETVADYLGEMKEEVSSLFNAVLQKEDIERLIEILINQLDGEKQLAIVIDDFQHLEDEALVDTIEYFIKHMPENVHIVILTRDEPSIYFGDLVMNGSVLYIDEAMLKFSPEEGVAFLTGSLGLKLNEEVVSEINELCEGWVGGLQLIALACINRSPKVMKDIKIYNKYAVDYLSKEILDSLPEKYRSFLIKTCNLSYFNEDICNRLLGINNSRSIIQELLDKDLFIICIDEERELYRYHNIFGEFLRLRFSTFHEAEKSELYTKAALIFKAAGDLEESIRQLYCNRDYGGMIELLKVLEPNYKGWVYLPKIPVEHLKEDVDLIIQLFFYYYYNADLKGIENMVESCKKEMEDQSIWRFVKIVKAMLVDFDMCTDLMTIDEIEQFNVSSTTKAILYLKTAAFCYIKFELHKALQFIERAAVIDSQNSNPFIRLTVLSLKCGVKEELGELSECERLFSELFKVLEKSRILSKYMSNYYIGLTGILIKAYKLDQAEEALLNAQRYGYGENLYIDAGYLYNLAEVRILQGQKEEGQKLLLQVLSNHAYKNILYASGIVKLLIYANILTPEFTDKYKRMYMECDPAYLRIEDKLAYAKVLMQQGSLNESLSLVDEILPVARNQKIKYKLVEAILFKINILANSEKIDNNEIKNLMREAVYYGYENRIISPFIYEGQYLSKYLAELKEEKIKDLKEKEKVFINELINYLKQDNSEEQLISERELEVLREMSTGATNKEIGEKLCISVSTVKTHIINIYSKLQINSRVEAVEYGRKQKWIV